MLPNPHIFGIQLDWYTFFPKVGVFFTLVFGLWYYFKKAAFRLSFTQFIGLLLLLYVIMIGIGRVVGMFEFFLTEGYFPGPAFFLGEPSAGGFRWCGSLLGILLFFPFLSKKILRIQTFNSLLDLLVLCFCVFTVFIKQACQLSGDGCYGLPTSWPMGMFYPYGNAPNIIPVHPTPVYDSLFHLLFFIWLLNWDLKRKKKPGLTAKIYFLIIPIFYILLEIIRNNPVIVYDITLPQLVYGLIILMSIPIFKKLLKKEPEKVVLQKPNSNHKNNNKYSYKFYQKHQLEN